MRFVLVVLALGLLIAPDAPADAARLHRGRPRQVTAHRDRALPWGYDTPGWAYAPSWPAYGAYAAPRPDPYDDTPSYDDPSKFGG